MIPDRSQADDLRRYARTLDDGASVTAGVVASLTAAWADATGREWAERLRLVGRELDRLATVALDHADAVDRHTDEEPTGVLLGAMTGARTTTRRGVVVPTLPEPTTTPPP